MSIINGNYKEYKGYKYPINFPEEWILNEKEYTGRECANCMGNGADGYAMWRGVILGYCCNCAREYDYERGPGFYCYGREMLYKCPEKSAYETYLKGVNLEEIGDLSVNPNDTLENNQNIEEVIQDVINDIKIHEASMRENVQCKCMTCLERNDANEEAESRYDSYSDNDSL